MKKRQNMNWHVSIFLAALFEDDDTSDEEDQFDQVERSFKRHW